MKKLKSFLNQLKNHKYKVIIAAFAIWMMFIDTNSCLRHYEIKQKLDKTEERKAYYQEEINKDRKAIQEMKSDPDNMEKYARERFYMKKKDEEIFIIKEEK